jgi:hypothetical protein
MSPIIDPAAPPAVRSPDSSVTAPSLPTRVYSFQGGSFVLYLLIILVVAALAYLGWRAMRAQGPKPPTRVIGPDDDPDFLWRLGRDTKPR